MKGSEVEDDEGSFGGKDRRLLIGPTAFGEDYVFGCDSGCSLDDRV